MWRFRECGVWRVECGVLESGGAAGVNSNLYIRVSGMMGDDERTEVDRHFDGVRGVLVFGWRDGPRGKTVRGCVIGELPSEIFITTAKAMRLLMGRSAFFWLMLGVLIMPKRALKEVSEDE